MGGSCPQSIAGNTCKVGLSINGSRMQQKTGGNGCADCNLPPSLGGVANLGVSIGLGTSQTIWLQKKENHNLAGQIKYYFSYVSTNSSLARGQIKDIVNAGMNKSLVSAFPFIKYPDNKAKEYSTKYPKLTEYLKNQLPKVAGISKIVDAIHEFTQLPKDRIEKELQWEEGPELNIVQLDKYLGCTTCTEDTVGYFDKPDNPNKIFLDIDFVNELENKISNQGEEDAFLFFLGTTILHEYVHYGDYNNGFDYPGEEGRKFEIKVYGENIHPDRARIILNRLYN